MAQGASYDPLPQSDDSEDKLDPSNTPNTTPSNEGHCFLSTLSRQAIRVSLVILGICAVVDACLGAYVAYLYLQSRPLAGSSSSSDTIPLRHTYIGFDRLYSNQSHSNRPIRGPVVNLPRASIQVSATEKTKVYPQWMESLIDDNGIVPVFAQRLHVTPQVSTIVQFRAIDYGMEDCVLALTVPPTQTNSSGFIVSDFEEDRVAKVDVWSLSTESKLDRRTLSWNTKPERGAYVGRLDISSGSGPTYNISKFPCSWGSYHTFELSCATSECGVDATSVNKTATGLYMLQYQTA